MFISFVIHMLTSNILVDVYYAPLLWNNLLSPTLPIFAPLDSECLTSMRLWAIVCVCMLKVVRKTSNELTKCCNVFVYVISWASLCSWCCMFSWPYCFCFVLQAHVRCKCLINTPLHVLHLFCSSDLVCVASIWVVVLAACSPGRGGGGGGTVVEYMCVCALAETWVEKGGLTVCGGGGGGAATAVECLCVVCCWETAVEFCVLGRSMKFCFQHQRLSPLLRWGGGWP